MDKFLTRTENDLILDTIGLREEFEKLLGKVGTVSELAWLRQQLNTIMDITFGKKLGENLPMVAQSNEEDVTDDEVFAYTE